MNLTNFLSDCTSEELTERLLMLDQSIKELHQYGLFVVGDLSKIEVIDDEITLESFKNKVDYLDSGFNIDGDVKDIREMCAIGICAYNHFGSLNTSEAFLDYLESNLELFLKNPNIPVEVKEYYRAVFKGNFKEYMNDYLARVSGANKGSNKANVKVKTTAVGKALANKEAAYVNVLLIPSILVLIYLVFIVVYWIIR